jgi:ArsR family metal-binding transcriptional regulator
MPEMSIHKSGGIVFTPTKEEQEIRNLKNELRREIEEAKKLTEQLRSMMPK